MDLGSLGLFEGEEHQPFLWHGGKPAALLVHGFPGTPAEMRSVGQVLNEADWTVQGLLLPGFGQEIENLFEKSHQDWVRAAHSTLAALQERHAPLLLVGYSMGGAVAMNVAAENSADGLILLAPFWRTGGTYHRAIWQVLKRLFRTFRPFRRVSFSDPRVRKAVTGFLPDVDLDDPAAQQALRELRIPTRLLDQVVQLGQLAGHGAERIRLPILVVQGLRDETVRPDLTRQLLQRFPGPVQYREVQAGHDIVRAGNDGWRDTSEAILTYARQLAPGKEL